MRASNHPRPGMSLIVKTVVRLVASFILLFGIYIVLYGHITPGGGFAGGVIIAGSLILMLLAFGKQFVLAFLSEKAPTVWDCIGAAAFLLIAVAGYFGGTFFLNLFDKGEPFRLFSGGIIPLCNMAIGLKVGAGLFGAFMALSVFRLTQKGSG